MNAPLTSSIAAPARGTFGRRYDVPAGSYDEMFAADGSLRASWQMFVSLMDDLGPAEVNRRWDESRRLIHENGVTYNVYGDPAGMDRPWNLDAIPFLISHHEWEALSRGLTQRARLLELVLADIYGRQKLLADGLLPPELLYSNPNFLRSCYNVAPAANRWLHLYAADLGRSAEGNFVVIGDRTQAPSGAGYALENRLVISRALPDVFRDCRVQRLAGFFRTLRETLHALSPRNKDNPRIVLLTPGPYNETYFEHAYLARYLGYTLVEGGDLTVRDNAVFIKTLGGLQPVDVILRRQDDNFCDPLELRGDSSLGVPGLVQAVRANNVAVANALGSGTIESPALMSCLPRLARHLLGEDLLLQSVNSWWCGTDDALQHVLSNLHRLVIKHAFPGAEIEPVFGEMLSRTEREALANEIRANPQAFVGEEQIQLSTTPVLAGHQMQPRHLVLRSHLVASGDTYSVMPGGLTRFSASPDTLVVSMQRGGGSKDTWILSGGPVDEFSLLTPSGTPVALSRSGGDLSSRVADNLFWLGRYVERAEGLARLARTIMARITDQHAIENAPEIPVLLQILMGLGDDPTHAAPPKSSDAQTTVAFEQRLLHVITGPNRAGLQSCLRSVHRLASIVRDRISVDGWRIINRFEQEFFESAPNTQSLGLSDLLPALDRLIITFAAFGGLAMESMTRGQAWRFMDMGRRIERSTQTLALVRGSLVRPIAREAAALEAVLEVADSSMTYRRRYLTTLQTAPVLDLLLADETNPRSVGFQLAAISEHVTALPKPGIAAPRLSAEEQTILRALTGLRLTDFQTASKLDGRNVRATLDTFIAATSEQLLVLAETISQDYLSHAAVPRQLGILMEDRA
jgi:uncharacterized circularly permuted ATP-grasp superfamily protein/uncharacterized alpha-E superfamily protein